MPACKPETAVGKLISRLNAGTAPATVEALAKLTDDERRRLEQLNSDLSSDPAKTAAKHIALKNRIDGFISRLEAFTASTDDNAAQSLRDLAIAFQTARAAAAAASTAIFATEPLPHVGSDVWRALWEAARAYSEAEAYPGRAFPVLDGAVCVLCQQDLSPTAARRISRFESFVKDESKRRETEAKLAYDAALEASARSVISQADILAMVACIRDELDNAELATKLERSALLTLSRHCHITRHHADDPAVSHPPAEALPVAEFRAQAEELGRRAGGLTADANSEARRKLIAQRDELADRDWLGKIKLDVLAEIERRKETARLENASKDTATNRITSKSTEIAQQLVTNALRAQFSKEVASEPPRVCRRLFRLSHAANAGSSICA